MASFILIKMCERVYAFKSQAGSPFIQQVQASPVLMRDRDIHGPMISALDRKQPHSPLALH